MNNRDRAGYGGDLVRPRLGLGGNPFAGRFVNFIDYKTRRSSAFIARHAGFIVRVPVYRAGIVAGHVTLLSDIIHALSRVPRLKRFGGTRRMHSHA